VIGNLLELRRDLLGTLTGWAGRYGDLVRYSLGGKPAYLASGAELIAQLLLHQVHRYRQWEGPRETGRMLYGDGLVSSEGELWKRQRRLSAPHFNRKRIDSYAAVTVDYVDRLFAAWPDGGPRDVHSEMMRLALRIICKALFDAEVAQVDHEVEDAVNRLLRAFMDRMLLGIHLPDWLPLPATLRMRRAIAPLDALVGRLIAERQRAGEDRGDYLSALVMARDQDGSAMPDRLIRDEIMTGLVGGHESTAVAMTWALYLLARHPEIQERASVEVQRVLAGRLPTAADLPALPYVEMVVHEALRLYPPFYLNGRETIEEVELGGYRIPKGRLIFYAQWIMQRQGRYFDQPERFWPERWAEGLMERLPKYAYFPFGGGPRICIGNMLALMEIRLLVAMAVQRFRLALPADHALELEPMFTLRPKGILPIVFRRR
jgi:cytochrome P450